MPVSYGTYQKQLKLLPLTLYADGSSLVMVRFGYVGSDGLFNQSYESAFSFTPVVTSSILDAQPTPGLSRRDDLSQAIYVYLVSNGLIESGEIT